MLVGSCKWGERGGSACVRSSRFQWILDVLVCNWLGLYVGMKLCTFFELQVGILGMAWWYPP